MSEWVTTKEASDILGVNIRTIQRYVEKGKLRAKIISGRNVVKKDAIAKLLPQGKEAILAGETQAKAENNSNTGSKDWSIPEGYLLIDRSTLESLREQIKKLTDSVGEMQLTQKLLIEKGLNLKEEKTPDKLLQENNLEESSNIEPTETAAIVSTPIENVAKAHEEFFGKKDKKGTLSIIGLVVVGLLAIAALLIIVNFLANKSI